MSQWQYLGHVEPVLPIARTGSPAQVEPCLPAVLPRRAGLATALLVAAAAFVPAPTAALPILDWPVETVTPVHPPRFARFETGAERVLEVPQSQHVTWAPEVSDGRERPARRVVDFATQAERVLEVPESQHLTWWPQGEQNPSRARRVADLATGAERPTRFLIAQLPDVSWQVPLSEARRIPRRVVAVLTGAELPYQAIPRPVPAMGAWVSPLVQPMRRIRHTMPEVGQPPFAAGAIDYPATAALSGITTGTPTAASSASMDGSITVTTAQGASVTVTATRTPTITL